MLLINICTSSEHLPLCQVEWRPTGSSPGPGTPLITLTFVSFDEPGTGRQAHLKGQGLHAAVHPGQLGVEQGGAAHTQAVAGVWARGVDVQHRCRAGREARWHVGTGQVLQLGVRWDFGWEVVDGHAGVETVGVDFVQVSQAGRTAQRLGVQHPRQWEKNVVINVPIRVVSILPELRRLFSSCFFPLITSHGETEALRQKRLKNRRHSSAKFAIQFSLVATCGNFGSITFGWVGTKHNGFTWAQGSRTSHFLFLLNPVVESTENLLFEAVVSTMTSRHVCSYWATKLATLS